MRDLQYLRSRVDVSKPLEINKIKDKSTDGP